MKLTEITDAQIQRLIPRAKALGTTHVRIMSYAVRKQADGSDHAEQLVDKRVKRFRDILADLKALQYEGWISIEPHMAVVFHETSGEAKPDPEGQYRNFVDYGRKLGALIDSL